MYLDFQKAFDKVPHRHLLTKLEENGVNGMIVHWIDAFLSSGSNELVFLGHFLSGLLLLVGLSQLLA